jgi:peptidase E
MQLARELLQPKSFSLQYSTNYIPNEIGDTNNNNPKNNLFNNFLFIESHDETFLPFASSEQRLYFASVYKMLSNPDCS